MTIMTCISKQPQQQRTWLKAESKKPPLGLRMSPPSSTSTQPGPGLTYPGVPVLSSKELPGFLPPKWWWLQNLEAQRVGAALPRPLQRQRQEGATFIW